MSEQVLCMGKVNEEVCEEKAELVGPGLVILLGSQLLGLPFKVKMDLVLKPPPGSSQPWVSQDQTH